MKLSEILNKARNGEFIAWIELKDASKAVLNAKGSMTLATCTANYPYDEDGDEIVLLKYSKRKHCNISKLKRQLSYHSSHGIVRIMIGGKLTEGAIEVDE